MTTFVLWIAAYLFLSALYSVPGALLLAVFTRIVTGIELRYGQGYGIAFAAAFVTSVTHEFIRLGTPPSISIHPAVTFAASCVISILVSGLVFGKMIETRRSHDPIGYTKGTLIALLYYAVVTIVFLPILILAVGLELIGR